MKQPEAHLLDPVLITGFGAAVFDCVQVLSFWQRWGLSTGPLAQSLSLCLSKYGVPIAIPLVGGPEGLNFSALFPGEGSGEKIEVVDG